MAISNPERYQEGTQHKYDRLSVYNAQKLAAQKEILAEDQHQKFDYKPKINETSRILAQSRTLNTLIEEQS